MSLETTGVKADSYEAGLEHLRQFPLQSKFQSTYNYALLMEEEDGSYTIVERVGMPCWGALREYNTGNRAADPWPGDLRTERHLFPKHGKPVAVAAFFPVTPSGVSKVTAPGARMSPTTLADWNAFIDFCFDPSISPWKQALKGFELIKAEGGNYQGVVFTDTNIDPNVMVGLLRTNCKNALRAHNFGQWVRDNPGIDLRIAYLKCMQMDSYYMVGRVVLDSYFKGESTVDMEGTFYERTSYNRPDIQFLWGGKNNAGVIVNQLSVDDLVEALNVASNGVVPQGN